MSAPKRKREVQVNFRVSPEELFDHLLVEYESFASIQLTKGRREENEDDEEQVRRLCQKYLDRREEAMK